MSGRKFVVKNRAPAAIQITSEQLLREAHDRGTMHEGHGRGPRSQITDPDELREYRMTQRKGFEDAIRMNRVHLGNYVKYAKWEEAQEEFERARSVFERAIDVDYRSQSLWLKYAEMEMRNKFLNHARNVWDRAVTILPRVDQFWFKYTYMEEMVENYAVCRAVFERWMAWEPDDKAWHAYAAFEERRQDARRARAVLERFVKCHPRLPSYLKLARWEEKQQQIPLARDVYERCLRDLSEWELEDGDEAKLLLAFAKFEEKQREHARARAVYAHACARCDREAHPEVHAAFLAFEKKHGAVDAVEQRVNDDRRAEYEGRVAAQPRDYDAWFDLARLEEAVARDAPETGDSRHAKVRDCYERAVAQAPPPEKRYWRRYAYLWLNYACYEELEAKDAERTRAVYRAALDAVPHGAFTLGKLWLAAAHFEVRQRDLAAARRLLGEALGRCKALRKPKLYAGYARLERQLGEVERCRKIYSAWVEAAPDSAAAWVAFADLEAAVGEQTRARAVCELAVARADVDKPEHVWKRYIDLEIHLEKHPDEDDDEGEAPAGPTRAAALYERLLERTRHVKVWMSYAAYEAEAAPAAADAAERRARARDVYTRANAALKDDGAEPEDRVALLDAWISFEDAVSALDGGDYRATARALYPRKVKKRRPREDDPELTEEYMAFVFPDDAKEKPNLKLLDMAKQWKAAQKKRKLEE